MNQFITKKQEDFTKALDFFKKEINSIRTGRANPSILESVQVEAYGVKSPINAVANVNIADGNSMTIIPYDRGTVKEIEKAISDADLGLGIVNEGDKIRLSVPQMTEDNRKELVKKLNEKHEQARVSIRQIREDIKNEIEAAFDDKEIAEDDKFRFIKELDEEISQKNDELKEIKEKKEKDIMTV
jgi:ribosome recycling factor